MTFSKKICLTCLTAGYYWFVCFLIRRIQAVEKDNDEVKNLNKAVGRLFENLKIQKLSEIARESTGLAITHDRSPTMMKKPDDSDDFKEIIKKVRGLEMELLRQKASQSSELKRFVDH